MVKRRFYGNESKNGILVESTAVVSAAAAGTPTLAADKETMKIITLKSLSA